MNSIAKSSLSCIALMLLVTACDRPSQPSDAVLRQKLTGSWKVDVIGADGSSDTHGTFTLATDGTYRTELTTSASNELRPVTLQGFLRIQDGYLVETTTNAVPHWLPESKRGTLPAGGTTSRTKIIRLDDHEMLTETNSYGTVLYTKLQQ